jgi:hypothetical protein
MNRKMEPGSRRGWVPVRKARHSSSGLAYAGMRMLHYASWTLGSGIALGTRVERKSLTVTSGNVEN